MVLFQTQFRPGQVHPSAFIAQGAVVVGEVTIGEEASIWFNATLRGDTTSITVGPRSNIQEGCIFHADPGFPAVARRLLGPVDAGARPVQVVAADQWQAARSTGVYTLVGCTVGPGFEFEDFQMLEIIAHSALIRPRHAGWRPYLRTAIRQTILAGLMARLATPRCSRFQALCGSIRSPACERDRLRCQAGVWLKPN